MVALRCASLALLVALAAAATDCDKDELDLCDDTMGTSCDAEELDLCDDQMGGGGSMTDCDADELDLCDDTSGGGGSIDDSASPLCDGEELDLCDYMHEATPAPTPEATPAATPEATPAPTMNACDAAGMEFVTACADVFKVDEKDTSAMMVGYCTEGACHTAWMAAATNCADNEEKMKTYAPIKSMCSPCMQKVIAASQVCLDKDDKDKMDEALVCSDACASVIAEMKTDECDKMSDGRRLSAEELKISEMVRNMVSSVPSVRRLGGHEKKDENPAAQMMMMQEYMCSDCGKAAMPWMAACGFKEEDDDHDDHDHDRRLEDHEMSKMMCWDVCQEASQKVKDACKSDRRLGGHEEDEKKDEFSPAAMYMQASQTIEMCTPCGVAMMAIGHHEDAGSVECAGDSGLNTDNSDCKNLWCGLQRACPAADGLTEAPPVVQAAKMDFDEYKQTMTAVAALSCLAVPTPAPTTANTILTIEYALAGDYETVVGNKKEQFLTECTEKLKDSSAVCSDVRAGSIIVDITGKLTAATAAVQQIESSDDKSLTLASFGALKAQGKVATVAAGAEAVTKFNAEFPAPAPAPAEEDADGAVSMYGTLAGTSMAIAVANIL